MSTTETAEQRFEDLTRRNHTSGALTVPELCECIEAGFSLDKSGLDDDMLDLTQELADRTSELRQGAQALALLPELAQALQQLVERYKFDGIPNDSMPFVQRGHEAIANVRDAGLI